MKKLFIIVLILFSFLNHSFKDKEKSLKSLSYCSIPPDTIRIFYGADSVGKGIIYWHQDPYQDTGIYVLNDHVKLFRFPGEERILNIYFDKTLKQIGATYYILKKDSSIYYKGFDRKGRLRHEYAIRQRNKVGCSIYYYSNNKVCDKTCYTDNTKYTDSIFYRTGELEKTIIHINSSIFKYTYYYRNGNVSSEEFWHVSDKKGYHDLEIHNPRYFIKYDSLTGIPKSYYEVPSIRTYKDGFNEATEVSSIKIPIDSAEVKRIKKRR